MLMGRASTYGEMAHLLNRGPRDTASGVLWVRSDAFLSTITDERIRDNSGAGGKSGGHTLIISTHDGWAAACDLLAAATVFEAGLEADFLAVATAIMWLKLRWRNRLGVF